MRASLAPISSLVLALFGCGGRAPLRAEMAPMAVHAQAQQQPAAPMALAENHFSRDRTSAISEDGLREVLAAPVFLEGEARLGVVPVATLYEPDPELPLATVPQALSQAMEASGI
ncbi:hypothetical protein KKB55_11300, partial [Myxococcota bacterium]|nr:hypothetical protein [Myxococcota bacterium]MBU1898324.1 hypothetical protein [Myxococcota bacterium]